MPPIQAEQASTLSLSPEAADFFREVSKGAGASTATPEPSVASSMASGRVPTTPKQRSRKVSPTYAAGALGTAAATEERPFAAGETSHAPSSPGRFPRNETERRIFERCRDTYLSRGLPLPHDMLFGFVRTNSKEYTAADETRWGDSALAHLDEALQLFHEAKVDRNVQRLLPTDQEARRARVIFDECWPYVELGQGYSGHWTVLDRLGSVDFDRLHRELGHDQVLQCYAQRMERVRQSKLKLAKAVGTAGYYHTTVIDMCGFNSVFLKHRGVIQRTFRFSATCYPETVFRIYLINCPSASQLRGTCYLIITHWLPVAWNVVPGFTPWPPSCLEHGARLP